MGKKKRKVPIHLSLDEDEYEDYKISLRGTRFDKNGDVNASAAIRYYIQSVNEERKKSIALTQSGHDRSAIKQVVDCDSEQITLDKVCADWMLDCDNHVRQNQIQDSLTPEDNQRMALALSKTAKRLISRLPQKTFVYEDKYDHDHDNNNRSIKKQIQEGKIQVITMEEGRQEQQVELEVEEEEVIE